MLNGRNIYNTLLFILLIFNALIINGCDCTLRPHQIESNNQNEELENLLSAAIENNLDGNYQRAIEICNEILEIDPDFASAYISRGSANAHLGNNEIAINDYLTATELDPTLFKAWYNLGCLYTYSSNYNEAIEYLSKAVELEPTKPRII